jgi:hypothetical protein
MSDIRKDENGALLVLHQFEEVTVERAKELVEKLEADLAKLRDFLAGTETQPAPTEPTPPAPTEPAPTETPVVTPAEPVPETTPVAPAPVDPAAPVAPAVEGTPATDAAGNPITLQ